MECLKRLLKSNTATDKRSQVSSLVVFSLLFYFPVEKRGLPTSRVSHFTLAYIEEVDGRTDVRTYGDVITKISRIDGLPHFLTNGAPHARLRRAEF